MLMALLLLKMMAVPLTFLQYNLNKTFIAANLCENVAKPQLQCEGKCHLKKEIAKNSEAPNPSGEKGTVKIVSADYFLQSNDIFSQITLLPNYTGYAQYHNLYAHNFSSLIFHPPLQS